MWIRVIRGDKNDNLRVSLVSARIFLREKFIVRIEYVQIRAIRGDNFVLLRLQISFHDEKTDTSG